jgi:hypothetical protein
VLLVRAFFQYTAWAVSRSVDLEAAMLDVMTHVGDRAVLVNAVRLIVEADPFLAPVAPAIVKLVRTGRRSLVGVGPEADGPDDVDQLKDRVDRSARPHRTVRDAVRRGVLDFHTFTELEVGLLLGSPAERANARARSIRRGGGVVAIPWQDVFLFPAFQFDEARHRPWPIVYKVNRILDARRDPWGAGYFWTHPDPDTEIEPYRLINQNADEELLTAARLAVATGPKDAG